MAWVVEKVVLVLPVDVFVVLRAEDWMAGGWGYFAVVAADVVGDEVHDDFQASLVGAADEVLVFFYSMGWVVGEIWIDVVIVYDCVWGAGVAFDELRVRWDAALVCGDCGVADNSGEPDVGATEPFDVVKGFGVDAAEFACVVVCDGAVWNVFAVCIAPEAREELVYNHMCGSV